MSKSVSPVASSIQRVLPDASGAPVKADLRSPETDAHMHAERERDRRRAVGKAIDDARRVARLTVKALALEVGIARGRAQDPGEVSRWLSGDKRPPLDALMAVSAMRQPLLLALAILLDDSVEIHTTIRIKRTA